MSRIVGCQLAEPVVALPAHALSPSHSQDPSYKPQFTSMADCVKQSFKYNGFMGPFQARGANKITRLLCGESPPFLPGLTITSCFLSTGARGDCDPQPSGGRALLLHL